MKQNSLVKTENLNTDLHKLTKEQVITMGLVYLNDILQTYGLPEIDIANPQTYFMPVAVAVSKQLGSMFLEKAKETYKQFREKGKIKDDYVESNQHKSCLKELLLALEDETTDEKRFEILNKIFLVASTEKLSNRNDPLPLEYMRKCRTLTAGEILVLVAEYNHIIESKSTKDTRTIDSENWLQYTAQRSGLKHPELVAEHELELISKHLLNDRAGNKKEYVHLKEKGRLTNLGFGICEYIRKYDELEKELK